MQSRKITIGVIGGNETSQEQADTAFELGEHIAANGAVLICGGKGGVMEAVSKGVYSKKGTVVGILPESDKKQANPYVTIAIPTGLGIARNVIVVHSSDVIIAFPGAYGTLSEIAVALALNKTVIRMPGAWDLRKSGPVDAALFKEAFDVRQAIGLALSSVG
ncbi:MAG: TIGR00725 family protein [Chitinispirillaceae bacterium]